MRPRGTIQPAVRALVALLIVCAAAGCSALPFVGGKPAARVRMTATPECNSCGKAGGYPLTFRIVQLKDASALTGVALPQLWGKEDKLLSAVFVSRSADAVIDPGTRRELSVELAPETKAVAVIANFCRTEAACWHHVVPRKGGGGVSVELRADSTCLRPAK